MKYQNTLLAGVAALALVAGTGLASAQQSNEHAGGSKAASPQAGQSMSPTGSGGMSRDSMRPQAQQKSNGTQTQAQERRGGTQTPNTAQQQRTLKGLQGNTTKPMQGQNQQGANPQGNDNTSNQAQTPQNNERGAQANGGAQAQGGGVQFSEQQRTQIRDTVINGHNAPRVGRVDFDVRVGTVIPRGRIHVVPVPETLVRIEPQWRGFLYFVYEDEVVIVNPRTMHIVAVVPA